MTSQYHLADLFETVAATVPERLADIAGSVPYAEQLACEPGGPWKRSEDDFLLAYTGGTTGMPRQIAEGAA